MRDDELTKLIIGLAFKVHNTLGPGYLEKVYENALRIELCKSGLSVKQQNPISVYYGDEIIGDFVVDLWVEDRLIIEVKAISKLNKQHEVQLVNYLTATGVNTGLLINFGPSVQVKRKFRNQKKET